MNKITLKAEKREVFGRKIKSLRKNKIIPGNVYGVKVQSTPVQIKAEDFMKAYDEAGETGLIEMTVADEKKPVLISDVHVHPVSSAILHVDFRQVNLKEKITAAVPIEVVGESPAEKSGIGTVVTMIDEVNVEALPTDFPENITIDVSSLTEVDQTIYVKDLQYDKSKLTIEEDGEQIVVKVEPPQKEEEVVAPVAPEGGEEAPATESTGGEQATQEGTEESA